jgi:hypothetical protein
MNKAIFIFLLAITNDLDTFPATEKRASEKLILDILKSTVLTQMVRPFRVEMASDYS